MKTSANKELVHYYGQGLPFVKRVDFSAADKRLSTQEIEIGGIEYVLGSDIHPSDDDTKRDVIFLFAEAVNGNSNQRKITTFKDNPFAFAKYEGDSILLIGRESGVDFAVTFAGWTVDPTVTAVATGSGGAIGSLIGGLTDPTVSTDPGVAPTTMISLLKGIVQNTHDIELVVEAGGIIDINLESTNERLGELDSTAVTNPAAASANLNSLIRGVLTAVNTVATKTTKELVDAAPDKLSTYTYLDAETADERISTVVTASASLSLSYTETYVYAGSAGSYRVSTVTRS